MEEQKKNETSTLYETQKNEYKQKYDLIPVTELKKWIGSWLVLVLSVLVSIITIVTLIDFFTTLNSGWFTIIKSFLNTLLSVLACTGFWLAYITGKSKNNDISARGFKLLHGVFIAKFIILGLIFGLILIACIFVFIACGKANLEVPTFFIIAFVAFIVILIAVEIFYRTIKKFTKNAITSFESKNVTNGIGTATAAFFFIISITLFIRAVIPVVLTLLYNKLLNTASGSSEFLSIIIDKLNLRDIFKVSVTDIIIKIVNSLTYISAGIVALNFRNIIYKINKERNALAKPIGIISYD